MAVGVYPNPDPKPNPNPNQARAAAGAPRRAGARAAPRCISTVVYLPTHLPISPCISGARAAPRRRAQLSYIALCLPIHLHISPSISLYLRCASCAWLPSAASGCTWRRTSSRSRPPRGEVPSGPRRAPRGPRRLCSRPLRHQLRHGPVCRTAAREGAVLEVGLEAPTSAERPPPTAPAREAPASSVRVWLANFMIPDSEAKRGTVPTTYLQPTAVDGRE